MSSQCLTTEVNQDVWYVKNPAHVHITYSSMLYFRQWYNDRGWPRINPVLERRFVDPPVGCDLGSACRFVHPNDADWKSSRSFRIPPPHLYSTGVRPETPDPYLRRHSSPVRKSSIKLEPHSPVIPLEEPGSATNLKYRNSRSRSRDRSLTTRIGLDKGRSPPRGPRKESRYSRERRGPSSEPRSPTLVRGRSPRQDHRRSHSRDTYNNERAEKPDLLDRIAMDVDEKSAKIYKGKLTVCPLSRRLLSWFGSMTAGGMRRPEADISPIATTSRPRSALDAPPTSASSQGSFLSATMPLPPPTPTIRQAPTMPRVPSLAPTINQVELKREELTPEARYKRWSERISYVQFLSHFVRSCSRSRKDFLRRPLELTLNTTNCCRTVTHWRLCQLRHEWRPSTPTSAKIWKMHSPS